jgi:hypothetical protein
MKLLHRIGSSLYMFPYNVICLPELVDLSCKFLILSPNHTNVVVYAVKLILKVYAGLRKIKVFILCYIYLAKC